jgi:hypothetical protein
MQKKKGRQVKGELREQIEVLEKLHRQGFLSEKDLKDMIEPLQQKLNEISILDE